MQRLSCRAATAAVVLPVLAWAPWRAEAQNLFSADGMWRATVDGFGQVTGFFTPPQPTTDFLSEAYLYEASPDGSMLSRRLQDSYDVTSGPTIDQGQTHSFTRLENAVGGGDPPSGNCCSPNGGPGCEDPVCEAAVCDLDPFCCESWDELCVDLAAGAPECDCVVVPLPLSIEIENTMVDGAQGGVLMTLRAINKSATDPIPVKLFYYVDLDIGSPNDDEATTILEGGSLVAIEQVQVPDLLPVWFGGCPEYKNWEIDDFPTLLDKLDDGTAQLASADGTVPGPADHTAALASAAATLGPGESVEFHVALGAPDFEGCPAACPWDTAGPGGSGPDGVVGINDLLDLLPHWGPCPGGPCPWDTAGPGGSGPDGVVGINDLLELLSRWGPCG